MQKPVVPVQTFSKEEKKPADLVTSAVSGLAGKAERREAARGLVPDAEPARVLLETGLVTLEEGTGAVRRYRLALDEIYSMKEGASGAVRVPAQADAQALVAHAESMAKGGNPWPALVLYPEGQPMEPRMRRVLTGKVLVKLQGEDQPVPDLQSAGLQLLDRPEYSRRHLVTRSRSGSPLEALAAMTRLKSAPGVESVTPLLKQPLQAMAVPDDPFFPQQWHLQNSGQGKGKAGMDVQVVNVWDQHQGQGINVGIVDTGVELNHPDLLAGAAPSGHLDLGASAPGFYAYDLNGHGTAVAGIVAAEGNNARGGTGVAPGARLYSIRLLDGGDADDFDAALSVGHGLAYIQVKNNSWGVPDGLPILGESGPLFKAAMEHAATYGRGGRGMISVWASGNGRHRSDQGNKDAYSNNIHAIAVGALTNTGALAFYSETGAHLTCVAPSGGGTLNLFSTDMTGLGGGNPNATVADLEDDNYSYTHNLRGTSFSAPVVSGVCALMLEARPELGWRDVKEILLRSSLKVSPTSTAWVSRSGGRPGDELLPPIKHHHHFGGGLVQAGSAVELAKVWEPLGPQIKVEKTINPNLSVNYTGVRPPVEPESKGKYETITLPKDKPKRRTIVSRFDMRGIQPMRVENVAVSLDIKHAYRGDLGIVLRSPSGAASVLVSPTLMDWGQDFENFTFTSMRHWGESGQGLWSLEITDYQIEDGGTFTSATLVLAGTAAPAAEITSQSGPQLLLEGSPVTLEVGAELLPGNRRQWRKDGKELKGRTAGSLAGIGLKVSDAGVYDHFIGNEWGHVATSGIPVAVVRSQGPDLYVNEGRTAVLKVVAGGAGLRFQWFRQGSPDPLVNNGRVTGVATPELTLRNVSPMDEDRYYCHVEMPGVDPDAEPEDEPVILAELSTQPTNLQIRRRPVLDAELLAGPMKVSESISRSLGVQNEVTRWSVTGLPPGVRFDTVTRQFVGVPTKAGRYVITLSAANAAGAGLPLEVVWEVQKLPDEVVGTFHGLVDRHEGFNGGLGGALTLTSTASGGYSGVVTRGVHRQSFAGRLGTASSDGAMPEGSLMISRRSPYGPLKLAFHLDPGTQTLTGELSDPAQPAVTEAGVRALRAAFSSGSPATAQVGRWNVAHELPDVVAGDATYPQGASWSTLVVSKTGAAALAGRMADGVAITSGFGLADSGEAPMHVLMHGGSGSVQGWQVLEPATRTALASLTWFKWPVPGSRSYAAGIPLHSLTGQGGLHVPPAFGEMLFGISPSSNNVRLWFTQGGLYEPFVQLFTLGAGNVVFLPPAELNPSQIRLTLNLATGILLGGGSAMDGVPLNPSQSHPRPGTFSALLVPQREKAVGHFLLPTGASAAAPVLSGKLVGEENTSP